MLREERFVGDCLEGIGFPSKGKVYYDTDVQPEIDDIVVCDSVFGGIIPQMKQVIMTGSRTAVCTRYKDRKKDYSFVTPEVYGVVLYARNEIGDIVYRRENSDSCIRTNPGQIKSIGIFDKETIYPNCTVQILTNTITGEESVGWWRNEQ